MVLSAYERSSFSTPVPFLGPSETMECNGLVCPTLHASAPRIRADRSQARPSIVERLPLVPLTSRFSNHGDSLSAHWLNVSNRRRVQYVCLTISNSQCLQPLFLFRCLSLIGCPGCWYCSGHENAGAVAIPFCCPCCSILLACVTWNPDWESLPDATPLPVAVVLPVTLPEARF